MLFRRLFAKNDKDCKFQKKSVLSCRLWTEELEDRRLLSVSPYNEPFNTVLESTSAETPIAVCCPFWQESETNPIIESDSLTNTINSMLTTAGQTPSNLTEEYIFDLNSCPDSSYTIYLDFTGHTTTGTKWNNSYGSNFVTPAYDTDGDTASFSNKELLEIYEIWLRVSEDYMPFGVNVSTKEPTVDALIKTDSSDTSYGVRCCLGGSYNDWLGSSAGGIAYLGSFNWNSDTPCFAFQTNNPKVIADAASHEVGHTLGLRHDGSSIVAGQNEYYRGANGWAPIMGTGYYQPLTQWSRGEYVGATNLENDLTIIASNGFTFRADDHGNTLADATPLTMSVSGSLGSGIIEQNTDVDCFQLTFSGEQTRLVVGGIESVTNLDVTVSLYDSEQTLLKTYNPTAWTNAVIDVSGFTQGTYYLTVAGAGLSRNGEMIYCKYGSLGAYTITADVSGTYGDTPNSINQAADFEWFGTNGSHTDVIGNSVSMEASGVTYYYDVDMYRINVTSNDVDQNYTISFTETAATKTGKCLRIFDSAGTELFIKQQMGDIVDYVFKPTVEGTYYIGASYYGTSAYTSTSLSGTATNFTPFEATVSVVRPSATNELVHVMLSTDSPKRSETLTAYIDPSIASVSWQWYRVDEFENATPISGAIHSEYTITVDDIGYKIQVTATGTGDYSGIVSETTANTVFDPTCVTTLNSTSTANDGVISLQEAVITALTGTFGTTVTFDAALAGGTITLNGEAIELTDAITIDASSLWNSTTDTPGITIDGDNASRIFSIEGSTADIPVSLIGLGLTNGNVIGYGGIIWNDNSSLTLTNCTVSNGTAAYSGGGIYSDGTLTLTDCTVSGNTTTSNEYAAHGGGIYCAGALTITGGEISGNTAIQNGGGIYSNGTLMLTDCTVSGNTTTSTVYFARGGGIFNFGSAIVTRGIFLNNTSSQSGGAIYNDSGKTLRIDASTFTGNSVAENQNGGAIYNGGGALTICNSVIDHNSVSGNNGTGSAVYSSRGGGNYSFTMINCTVADNTSESINSYALDFSSGNFDGDKIYNSLAVNNICGTSSFGQDINNVNTLDIQNTYYNQNSRIAGLFVNDSISDTDGLYDYHLLLPASNAINSGNNTFLYEDFDTTKTLLYSTDLAGKTRIVGSSVDLGAYESPETSSTVVTTLGDVVDAWDGLISLREAISYAGTKDLGNIITFAASLNGQIIAVASEFLLDKSLTIQGNGATQTIINAGDATRIFNVTAGKTVVFDGLTLAQGAGTGINGGAIYNAGTISVSNLTFDKNSATNGGAIYNDGTATVTNSTFNQNGSITDGGAIYNVGTATISNSAFSIQNSAMGVGGAIYNSGTMTVSDVFFNENLSATDGGAIYNIGTAVVFNATFKGNTAAVNGGAIVNNSASARLTLFDSTLTASNFATTSGGAIYNFLGTVDIVNSILADNSILLGAGTDVWTSEDAQTSVYYSLIGSASGAFITSIKSSIGVVAANIFDSELGAPAIQAASQAAKGGTLVGKLNDELYYYNLDSGYWRLIGAATDSAFAFSASDTSNFGLTETGKTTVIYNVAQNNVSRTLTTLVFNVGAYALESVDTPSTVVTVTADDLNLFDGGTSLREAIEYAGMIGPETTITFAIESDTPTFTIPSTITVSSNVTIDGTNAATGFSGTLIFDGGATVDNPADGIRLFEVTVGVTVTIQNAILKNSYSETSGGAVLNEGTLTLKNVEISGAVSAGNGGAIYNKGSLTLENVEITNTSSALNGGAIYNYGSSSAVQNSSSPALKNADLVGNRENNVEKSGSTPIIEPGAELVLNDVNFTGNSARNGGAICNYGTLTINGGSITSNTAERFGGAYFGCGDANFYGVAFTSNTAKTAGAIYSQSRLGYGTNGVANILLSGYEKDGLTTYCTFNANTASGTDATIGLGNGGAIGNWGEMTIIGASFGDGTSENANSSNFLGGAIMNGIGGVLTVKETVFNGNSVGNNANSYAGFGGAVSNSGTFNIVSGAFTNNSTNCNGGAIASSGTLIFSGTADDSATQFNGNRAVYYGGAIVSTGSLNADSFAASNKPVFGNTTENRASKGIDFANGFGGTGEFPVDETLVSIANTNNIFNYSFEEVSVSQGSLVSLERLGFADANKMTADIDGDGYFEELSWIEPNKLGFNVGENQLDVQLVDIAGNTVQKTLKINVLAVAPNISAQMTSIADGQIMQLVLDVNLGAPIQTWTVHWGDGKSSVYSSAAEIQNAVHYYALQNEDASYDVLLELTENGKEFTSVYFLGTHEIPSKIVKNAEIDENVKNVEIVKDEVIAESALPIPITGVSELDGRTIPEPTVISDVTVISKTTRIPDATAMSKTVLSPKNVLSKTVLLEITLSDMKNLPLTVVPLTFQTVQTNRNPGFASLNGQLNTHLNGLTENSEQSPALLQASADRLLPVFEEYFEEENVGLDFFFEEFFNAQTFDTPIFDAQNENNRNLNDDILNGEAANIGTSIDELFDFDFL